MKRRRTASIHEITRSRRKRTHVEIIRIASATTEAQYTTSTSVPVSYTLPAAPVNVHALKVAIHADVPVIHHGIAPPARK